MPSRGITIRRIRGRPIGVAWTVLRAGELNEQERESERER
jgi:hypothetical protein